jgi:predicted NBD/HSP70 family sugar kinase
VSGVDDHESPGTPSLLLEMNRRAVYEEVWRLAQSRSQLAASTRLSKPTVSTALAQLSRVGLVRQGGFAEGRPGPAASLYEPVASAGHVVGIQLDRRITIAVADLAGIVIARESVANRARSVDALVGIVEDLARSTCKAAGIKLARAASVVLALPGVEAPDTRSIVMTDLPVVGTEGFLDQLAAALGVECVVENDVNLAAVGEQRFGAAQGVRDFILVSLMPGLGLSLYVDGKLHRGVHRSAGEVAFLPIVAENTFSALIRTASKGRDEGMMREEAVSSNGAVRLAARLGVVGVRSVKALYRMAAEGDRLAKKAVRMHSEQLALTVAAASAVLDPEVVLLNGPVDESVLEHLRESLAIVNPFGPEVRLGGLGDDAVILGAIAAGLPIAHDRVFATSARKPRRGKAVPTSE